jgi:lipopolysaccharide/colanic/teichoic acid biosynthesis glycosyltransferase
MIAPEHKTIFDAESFARILGVERKRTDRSQRPFLLLLLELDELLRETPHRNKSLVKSVIDSFQGCLRQTDTIGWYQNNTVLGVIYTELHQEDHSIVRILERVRTALQASLTPKQFGSITISTYVYPHDKPILPDSPVSDKLFLDLKQHKLAYFAKRVVDMLGSLFVLVLCSPLFVLIGIAIKLTSKGPILFKQTRLGQFGQPFTFLKFRSMCTDADPSIHKKYVQEFIRQSSNGNGTSETLKQNGFFKLDNDPRITPVGHFLRRTSLDELPQLLNVLAGTMSLVGPRPPIPYELERYDTWHKRRVFDAKPGLTGLWQVQGRSRTTFDDMVRLDLKYIDEQSLRTDLKLLFQTPWAVLKCEGAR